MEPDADRGECDTVTRIRPDPLLVHRCGSSGTSTVIVPPVQFKQDFTFEIHDEFTAGVGTLGGHGTVQSLALPQGFDRLPVVLA
jgi:hypothetical protein